MGRFHRHADGTVHAHDHADADHHHESPEVLRADERRALGDHSAYATDHERIELLERILGENDDTAAANRRRLDTAGAVAVNVMSSPGAGKTTLVAALIATLRGEMRVGVVEGDITTSIDADRIAAAGAPVSLVNTDDGFGGECHLDAVMVRRGLDGLALDELDLVLIENVGNLVCPAEFDVGEHARLMVCSLTEGEDKPLKYPPMFRAADLLVLNKIDLLPHLDVDVEQFRSNLRTVNPDVEVIEASATRGDGVEAVARWLRERVTLRQ